MRFVVCGEALIDLVHIDDEPTGNTWRALSGGGPMNTAVALAKLGQDTHFLGRMGNDAFSEQLYRHLDSHGVQLDLAIATDLPTSLAVVSIDSHGKAQYTFHFDHTSNFSWQATDFPMLTRNDWMHCGSIATVIEPGAQAICSFIADTDAKLSLDVNVRPAVEPNMTRYREAVETLARLIGTNHGIVKASDEDLELLYGTDLAPVDIATAWVRDFGLALCIVTLGADGALACLADGSSIRVPGRTVEVVDTVGAGDTFMAGFLSRYAANPQDVEAALTAGVGAATLVCCQQGAVPPTAQELATFLK